MEAAIHRGEIHISGILGKVCQEFGPIGNEGTGETEERPIQLTIDSVALLSDQLVAVGVVRDAIAEPIAIKVDDESLGLFRSVDVVGQRCIDRAADQTTRVIQQRLQRLNGEVRSISPNRASETLVNGLN